MILQNENCTNGKANSGSTWTDDECTENVNTLYVTGSFIFALNFRYYLYNLHFNFFAIISL